jgi:hypothetical protein
MCRIKEICFNRRHWTICACILIFGLTLPGCRLFTSTESKVLDDHGFLQDDQDRDAGVELFQELGGEEAFLELAQYLYRWYLDENDFRNFNPEFRGKLWIRKVDRVLDKGDKSAFLELFFPAIRLSVMLKKTDYKIEELKLAVKSDGYKISSVGRMPVEEKVDPADYHSLDMDIDALYDYLFENRQKAEYPDEEMFGFLRDCVREQCEGYIQEAQGDQIIWLAPISPMANEVWVFWEDRKLLFHFVADVDMHKREIWEHDSVVVRHYDIVSQTVVTHNEKPGEDDFLTRDQVGRVLYNCLALGRKVEMKK